MANSVTGSSPWKLDTTGAISTTRLKIKEIYWFNPTNTAHTFILKDRNGKVIYEGKCEVVNQSQFFLVEQWFYGLTLDTLGSGTLYIYFY